MLPLVSDKQQYMVQINHGKKTFCNILQLSPATPVSNSSCTRSNDSPVYPTSYPRNAANMVSNSNEWHQWGNDIEETARGGDGKVCSSSGIRQ